MKFSSILSILPIAVSDISMATYCKLGEATDELTHAIDPIVTTCEITLLLCAIYCQETTHCTSFSFNNSLCWLQTQSSPRGMWSPLQCIMSVSTMSSVSECGGNTMLEGVAIYILLGVICPGILWGCILLHGYGLSKSSPPRHTILEHVNKGHLNHIRNYQNSL